MPQLSFKFSKLLKALESDNPLEVKGLLESRGVNPIDYRDQFGNTLLHLAMQSGQKNQILFWSDRQWGWNFFEKNFLTSLLFYNEFINYL